MERKEFSSGSQPTVIEKQCSTMGSACCKEAAVAGRAEQTASSAVVTIARKSSVWCHPESKPLRDWNPEVIIIIINIGRGFEGDSSSTQHLRRQHGIMSIPGAGVYIYLNTCLRASCLSPE